jgi:rubrerythrin
MNPPRTLEDFMLQALAMEREAAERYAELADMMETHNNHDVAALFRTMAGHEAEHAAQIMAEMRWSEAPPGLRIAPALYDLSDIESAEAPPYGDVHYLMTPWHALQMTLAAEQRAEAFFAALASSTGDESVRRAALELQAEEAEHVRLVQAWIAKVPQPEQDWALDPDPPRYID